MTNPAQTRVLIHQGDEHLTDTFHLREVLGGWSIIVNPGTPLECEVFGADGEAMQLGEAEAAREWMQNRRYA